MWDLPGPGLEPVSPALDGRFLTTAPPGKPFNFWYVFYFLSVNVVKKIIYSVRILKPINLWFTVFDRYFPIKFSLSRKCSFHIYSYYSLGSLWCRRQKSVLWFYFNLCASGFLPCCVSFTLFIYLFFTLFIYFIYLFMTVLGLLVFVWGLSLVEASGGHSSSRCGGRSSSRCAGLSLSRPLPLRGTGSRRAGSAAVAHGPSRSAACGILPDQGSNPCPPHQQADSQPLRHQGSPSFTLYFFLFLYL